MANLTGPEIADTWITDAGLARLKGLDKLQSLNLEGTLVSDAGLMHLGGLSNLQFVNAARTKATRPAAEKLKNTRPNVSVSLRD